MIWEAVAVSDSFVHQFDPFDFDDARRGLLAQHPTGVIQGDFGPAWDVSKANFVGADEPCPDTVHPSLWRQAQLNSIHGLFEVAPGCWQARGYDISNITFVEGDTGWIVIDPLTAVACARDCLAMANDQLGERPVVAVIYTHSHLDHFGGVLGVTTQEDVDAGRCRIIAPEHFMREVVAENLLAGPAMMRRALYQFGPLLPPGPRGHIDCGLGKATPLSGASLIAPTEDITHTGQELVVDGVRIVFQLTPETEAPAEMNFFFPDRGWLCMAENCTHTMHNLIPIRGAQARDALSWSKYINEAIELFGDRTELVFASHHWPTWGRENVRDYLILQRDLYRWMHDQTLRLANQGMVPTEIADALVLPPEFSAEAHTTGYYGALVHNVKAVYQRYLSWYDGNPVHLHPHPPVEAGTRYVELAGGADALLAHARAAFDRGDHRWVAEVVNHLVFADPSNTEARQLQADALEQLGFATESATFRNAYLMGAQELRNGSPKPFAAPRRGLVRALPVDQMLDTWGVRLVSDRAGGLRRTINLDVTDTGEQWVLMLSNRALSYSAGRHDDGADLTLTAAREVLMSLGNAEVTLADATADGSASVAGDPAAFTDLVDCLEPFMAGFAIIEP